MNTADYVDNLIVSLKSSGIPLSEAVWETAMACIGWSYVYGAWGALCTPSERQKRYRYHPEKESIKTKCKNFDGKGTCNGCQWFPDGKRTRCYDCRGFTDWCLKQFGIDLYGDSVGVQWNHNENWETKGTIKDIPDDILVCLFVQKDGKWQHTGFGYKGSTCECSSGVQYYAQRQEKWTHWAMPKGIGEVPVPTPTPTPSTDKPTLRKGDRGEYVTLMQTELIQKGYSCGDTGADGVFGTQTEKAVKRFQKDNGLLEDGICGKQTWNALSEQTILYTVTIPNLPKYHADALVTNYSGAYMTEEKG
jgi:hypothetical protein